MGEVDAEALRALYYDVAILHIYIEILGKSNVVKLLPPRLNFDLQRINCQLDSIKFHGSTCNLHISYVQIFAVVLYVASVLASKCELLQCQFVKDVKIEVTGLVRKLVANDKLLLQE